MRIFQYLVFASLIAISGFVSAEASQTKRAKLDVVTVNAQYSYLLYVHATNLTDGVMVSGLLKKRRHGIRSPLGHIHLEFLDENDNVLVVKKINLPGIRWGKHQHSKRFSRLFDDIPVKSRVVTIKNHIGDTKDHESMATG